MNVYKYIRWKLIYDDIYTSSKKLPFNKKIPLESTGISIVHSSRINVVNIMYIDKFSCPMQNIKIN